MKWYEYLKSSKTLTGGEDLADSIALVILMALVVAVVFI